MSPWVLGGVFGLACSGSGTPDSAATTPSEDTASTVGTRPATDDTATGPTDPGPSALVLSGPAPRNLLMISVDTLRRDKVGHHGGGDRTPFLDSVLAESFVLDDHRSCSNWTYSSVVCALTGQSPVDLGFEPVGNRPEDYEDRATVPPEDLAGLPHWLAAVGFETSLVSTSRFLSDRNPPGGGFATSVLEEDAVAARVTDLALAASEPLLVAGAPWFLHVHYRDPHFPWQADAAWEVGLEGLEPAGYQLGNQAGVDNLEADWPDLDEASRANALAWLHGLYDAEVRYFDDELGRLWRGLDEAGALDDTLVVLWTDHGEQLFDHEALFHYQDLYGEEAAALGAFWARTLTGGSWAGPTLHQDLVPAALEVLGVAEPDGVLGVAPGRRSERAPRHAFFGPPGIPTGPLNTVDSEGWRLYYDWHGTTRLYDLTADPLELDDLHGQVDAPRLERHLASELQRIQSYLDWATPVDPPE